MKARPVVRLGLVIACAAMLGSPAAGAAEPTGTPPESVGVESAARGPGAGVESAPDLGPWTGGEAAAAELRTPRSALERFLQAGEDGRFEEAAGVLNLSDLPPLERIDRGPDLAEKLYFVLDRRLDVDWRDIPDRPDGARDVSPALLEDEAPSAPAPRHNLRASSAWCSAGWEPRTDVGSAGSSATWRGRWWC